jgi:hypothetical protein
LAISRKGPRLLELLAQEGFLPNDVLGRTISEQSLPFIRTFTHELAIVDDSIIYGSTFNKILNESKTLFEKHTSGNVDVKAMPLAICEGAPEEYVSQISTNSISLKDSEISSFVKNETNAFQLLGGPLDIEHPIWVFRGDFGGIGQVENVIQQVCMQLAGSSAPIVYSTPTNKGLIEFNTWTVEYEKTGEFCLGNADFCKLRVYLNGERDQLKIAMIRPMAINKDVIAHMANELPGPLKELWKIVLSSVHDYTDKIKPVNHRSLAVWANYIVSFICLKQVVIAFESGFEVGNLDVEESSIGKHELQLLGGPDLAQQAIKSFQEYFSFGDQSFASNFPSSPSYPDQIIPPEYREAYEVGVERSLEVSTDINDAFQAIFSTQHFKIELSSRNGDLCNTDGRLEFGITFSNLRDRIRSVLPNVTDLLVHRYLDKYIDKGCIVPRYVNFSDESNPVWIRAFRVGEGNPRDIAYIVITLFESLSREMKKEVLPATLLEKFFVLSLTDNMDDPNLAPLRISEIGKVFYEYGARTAIIEGQEDEFLIDWAVAHDILDEDNGGYSLSPNLNSIYPPDECPWDDLIKESLEDLSSFVKAISETRGLKDRALVLLTSVATDQEFIQAIEKELDLWLHHPRYSVFDSLRRIMDLRSQHNSTDELETVNRSLVETANFTAQVNEKKRLADNRRDFFSKISKTVNDGNTERRFASRAWRKIEANINSRSLSENRNVGGTEVFSALRIAYQTNSILRNLLVLAGHKDEMKRGIPVDDSVRQLILLFNDQAKVDIVTRTIFSDRDGQSDIVGMLEGYVASSPENFDDAVTLIRPIIQEIGVRCEDVLRNFGTIREYERPRVLPPPRYIVMWDMRESAEVINRDEIEQPILERVNDRIASLGSKVYGFDPRSKDDGNGLICSDFNTVLAVFKILDDVSDTHRFRAGCEVNIQGPLNYYEKGKSLSGRSFEHTARVMSMFAEIRNDAAVWSGNESCIPEPESNYIIIGEFARRFARKAGEWPEHLYRIETPDGLYSARVSAALPISISILTTN